MKKEVNTKKTLIIAAHPDDEILGCGGTMAKLTETGNQVFTLILGEGVTSRDEKRDNIKRSEDINGLKNEIILANKVLNVKEVFTADFPDNRFDTVDFLDIVKRIEYFINKINPHTIFTHFKDDLNIDHKITYDAVLTATRPMVGAPVKEIYSFEVLSSTEWNFPYCYSPDVFIDISDYVDKKIAAMKEYNSELREYPHPRSIEGIELSAKYRGLQCGFKYAEAFKCVRILK